MCCPAHLFPSAPWVEGVTVYALTTVSFLATSTCAISAMPAGLAAALYTVPWMMVAESIQRCAPRPADMPKPRLQGINAALGKARACPCGVPLLRGVHKGAPALRIHRLQPGLRCPKYGDGHTRTRSDTLRAVCTDVEDMYTGVQHSATLDAVGFMLQSCTSCRACVPWLSCPFRVFAGPGALSGLSNPQPALPPRTRCAAATGGRRRHGRLH